MACGLCEDNARAQIQDPPHIAKAINALDHSFGLCGAPAIPASPNTLGKCRTKNHSNNIVPIRVAPHCTHPFCSRAHAGSQERAAEEKRPEQVPGNPRGHEPGDEAEKEKMIKAKKQLMQLRR
jgi:hypothetical protein